MLNRITIQGRLVAAPELSYTSKEIPFLKFSIAHKDDFTNQKGEYETHFISVIAWRSCAEFISKNFVKGQPIVIDGKLSIREYQDKDTGQPHRNYEISADSAYFSGGLKKEEAEPGDNE